MTLALMLFEARCRECRGYHFTDEFENGAPAFSSCPNCGADSWGPWGVSVEPHPFSKFTADELSDLFGRTVS